MHLIFYRALATLLIALVLARWFFPVLDPMQQACMQVTALLAVVLFISQIVLAVLAVSAVWRVALLRQWLFQYSGDIVLACLLVFSTGGILSPFSLLLGIIVIASGTHAKRILPLVLSVLACSGYVIVVYVELRLSHGASLNELLNKQQGLHILLQVSALLLVGGVMAYIARRHAQLSASSDQAVRQHRQLKDLHEKMMAEMREGVVLLDQQLHLVDMNKAAADILQRDALASLLAYPPLADFFHQHIQSTESEGFQCEYGQTGQSLLLAVRQLKVEGDCSWLLTIVDISEVRALQDQLMQQEKMAVLGQMAAMLAHEIRNPIQTMTQGLEIMAQSPANAAQMQQVFHDEMMRLNRLVSTMLQYSKPLHAMPVDADMALLIQASLQQINAAQRDDIHWHSEMDKLYLDGDHFRLVLDNLLSNALANRTDVHSPVELTLRVHQDRSGTRYWQLLVRNQGVIASTVREKLFDPFVSARPAGVGLGLATVQQVCAINRWNIDVHSERGETCFMVDGAIDAEEGHG